MIKSRREVSEPANSDNDAHISVQDEVISLQIAHQLINAASKGDLSRVRGLLENGADVRLQNRQGHTALFKAVQNHHSRVVRVLLGKGCSDIRHRDKEGRTALHLAFTEGEATKRKRERGEIIQKLVGKGVEVEAKNNGGKTARDLAKDRADLARFLKHQPKTKGIEKGPSAKSQSLKRPEPKKPENKAAASICKDFRATLGEFFFDKVEEGHVFENPTVYELLYGQQGPRSILKDARGVNKEPICWWYHLPANNV